MNKTTAMKNTLIFGLAFCMILGLLCSCSSWNTSLGRRAQYHYTAQTLPQRVPVVVLQDQWWQDKQVFQLDAERDTVLYTSGGTTLYFYAGTLLNAYNEVVKGSVTLWVQEAYTKGQMIYYNAPTVSNGRLLESGGELNIRMIQGNQELSLDPNGKGIEIRMATTIQPNMELFFAQRDRKQNINWVKDSLLKAENFDSGAQDSGYTEERYYIGDDQEGIYLTEVSYNGEEPSNYLFTTKKLGWINCDRFYNDSTEKTDFVVRLKTPMPEGQTLNAYIVFDDLNSVMPAYSSDNGLSFTASGIPVGSKVKLVVLGEMDKMFYLDVQPFEVSQGQAVWSSLNPYTKEGMKAVLDAL